MNKSIKTILILFSLFIIFLIIFWLSNLGFSEASAKDYLQKSLNENPKDYYTIIVRSDSQDDLSKELFYDVSYYEDNYNTYIARELYFSYDRKDDIVIKSPNKDIHIVRYRKRPKNETLTSANIDDEQYFNKNIKKVADSLNLKDKSDKEKVKAIYNYITQNYTYDDTYKDTSFNASGTFITKTGVCQGLTLIMQKMCNLYNIDNELITGSYDKTESHIYLLIKIDKYWYYCDPTWDIGNKPSDWQYFMNENQTNHPIDDTYLSYGFTVSHPTIYSLRLRKQLG